MPIESMSFIDVRARLNVAGSTMPLTLGRTQVDALDRLLSALDEKAILYFASGPYILPRLTTEYLPWQGDMTTPPNVTVWFDPGAIITLEGSRLVVLGGMTAPDAQVFAEHGAGMVMFGGELRELFPEWWGAKGEDGVDDTAAIQRAIDAGSARRAPVAVATGIHGGKSRRPIPVTLRRTYRVGGTVVIGRPVPPAPNETIITSFGSLGAVATSLRGPERPIGGPAAGLRALTPPIGGNPATGASPSDVAMASAVLRLDLAFAARVDNLVIDAAEVMDYALLINSGDNLPVKQTHSIAIQRCDLKGARKVQVQVGPPQVLASMESRNVVGIGKFVPVPAEQVHPGDGDTPGFNLANCLIECPRLATGSLSRGMSFRTANGVGLRVSDSDFRGPTICYVDVTAGMVILEGCDFANPELETGSGDRAPVSVERGFEGPGGEDVYLSAFGVLQGGDVPHLGSGYVAMVSCRSRSATMFGTPDPSPQGLNNGRPNRSSLILGCRHEPPLDFALSTPYSGTSVRWGRLAQGVPRMMHRGGPNYGSDGTLSVVGSYLAGAMRVVTGAAQSVLLATHTATAGNQPEIVPPSRESRVGGTYIRGIITVVFGFQCLALLMLLLATGCHSSAAITPRDVGADLGAPKTADLGGDLPSDGPLDIVRDAPEVEFTQDILDAGAAPDVADLDRSEQPALLDVPSAMDTPTMPPRYIDPEWAMQDVISRDIEVLRAPDAPLVWDFGPARQDAFELSSGHGWRGRHCGATAALPDVAHARYLSAPHTLLATPCWSGRRARRAVPRSVLHAADRVTRRHGVEPAATHGAASRGCLLAGQGPNRSTTGEGDLPHLGVRRPAP